METISQKIQTILQGCPMPNFNSLCKISPKQKLFLLIWKGYHISITFSIFLFLYDLLTLCLLRLQKKLCWHLHESYRRQSSQVVMHSSDFTCYLSSRCWLLTAHYETWPRINASFLIASFSAEDHTNRKHRNILPKFLSSSWFKRAWALCPRRAQCTQTTLFMLSKYFTTGECVRSASSAALARECEKDLMAAIVYDSGTAPWAMCSMCIYVSLVSCDSQLHLLLHMPGAGRENRKKPS